MFHIKYSIKKVNFLIIKFQAGDYHASFHIISFVKSQKISKSTTP
jgi:hypothetical protein